MLTHFSTGGLCPQGPLLKLPMIRYRYIRIYSTDYKPAATEIFLCIASMQCSCFCHLRPVSLCCLSPTAVLLYVAQPLPMFCSNAALAIYYITITLMLTDIFIPFSWECNSTGSCLGYY